MQRHVVKGGRPQMPQRKRSELDRQLTWTKSMKCAYICRLAGNELTLAATNMLTSLPWWFVSFGQVFVGRYQGTLVAVKRLLTAGTTDPETVKAFVHEVQLLARVRHPCIILLIGT